MKPSMVLTLVSLAAAFVLPKGPDLVALVLACIFFGFWLGRHPEM